MSGFVRNIQRALTREKFFNGRGSKLGVHNPKAADLKARLAREERHA